MTAPHPIPVGQPVPPKPTPVGQPVNPVDFFRRMPGGGTVYVKQVTALWATRPGWTRAHAIWQSGSMGIETYWATKCNRDYPLDDPEWDEPTTAPESMPHCTHCTEVLAGKRT